MSCSLNTVKGLIQRIIEGSTIVVNKGDTRI